MQHSTQLGRSKSKAIVLFDCWQYIELVPHNLGVRGELTVDFFRITPGQEQSIPCESCYCIFCFLTTSSSLLIRLASAIDRSIGCISSLQINSER